MNTQDNNTIVETVEATAIVVDIDAKKGGKAKEELVEGSKLQVRVRNLADAIKQSVTDSEDGNGKAGENVIADYLEQSFGVSKEVQKKMSDAMGVVYPAAKLANYEIAEAKMVADKELKSVSTTIPTIGDDYIYTNTTRSQVIGGRTVHGVTKLTHEVVGQRGVGQMAVVKDIISQRANDALANV
jgi:dGTP triphosphohydrolase